MQWIKIDTDLTDDPKFGLIAKRTKTRPGDVVMLWLRILGKASIANGDATGFDCELADYVLKVKAGKSLEIITAMQNLGLLKGMRVVNWDKWQTPKSEKDKANKTPKSASERQQEYRARQKAARNAGVTESNETVTQSNESNVMRNENVTGRNAGVTESNETVTRLKEENREEEIKNLNTPPLPPVGGNARGEPFEPSLEFTELRAIWDEHVIHEAEQAGARAYGYLKRTRQWPGLGRIQDDITKRKASGYWKPGYEPGLEKYLSELGWTAPLENPRRREQSASVKSFAEIEKENEERAWQRRLERAAEYDRKKAAEAAVCNS